MVPNVRIFYLNLPKFRLGLYRSEVQVLDGGGAVGCGRVYGKVGFVGE